MIKYLTYFLIFLCKKFNKVEIIPNRENTGDYLVRYHVLKLLGIHKLPFKRCSKVYIHKFIQGDTDYPHDHPWDFWTYVVDGSYLEKLYSPTNEPNKSFKVQDRIISKNQWFKRNANCIHKVKLIPGIKNPITICVIGKKTQEWGFWKNSEDKIHWKDYLKGER